jgi:ketosteroid isomerase-like protein
MCIFREAAMYRHIVRKRVLHLFAEANRGNWRAIVDELDSPFSYRFAGETPLGGTRISKPAMIAWFERLYRLFPGSQFDPRDVVVEGPPWRTRVMTYVRITGTRPADGGGQPIPYDNEFMQLMTIRWGRIASVLTIEDTQKFVGILPALSAAGFADARAEPITG